MNSDSFTSLAAILILCFALLVPGIFWFPRYTGLPREKAILALICSVFACGLSIAYALFGPDNPHRGGPANNTFLIEAAAGASFVFITALTLRLWGRWIGENATLEERQPGQLGVRAWFCTSNLIVGAILVVLLWLGHDVSPFFSAVVIAAVFAAYPLLRMESPVIASQEPADDLSAEREKILAMLEAGKLTPDECAELLQAIRQSSPSAPRQMPLTGGQRLMLVGAALVALGFFLPWIVVNPVKEANRMMGKMQSSMSYSFQGEMPMPDMASMGGGINMPNLSVSGGDIQRGLGWVILACSLVAALMPYVATTLDAATARTFRLLSLGVGGLFVLYLLTQNPRFVGIGLVMAAGGYVLEAIGAMREMRAAVKSNVA